MIGTISIGAHSIGGGFDENRIAAGGGVFVTGGIGLELHQQTVERFRINPAFGRYIQIKITSSSGSIGLHSVSVEPTSADTTATTKR
jgi:hypothetical protein